MTSQQTRMGCFVVVENRGILKSSHSLSLSHYLANLKHLRRVGLEKTTNHLKAQLWHVARLTKLKLGPPSPSNSPWVGNHSVVFMD